MSRPSRFGHTSRKSTAAFAVLITVGLASLGAQNPAAPAIKTTVRSAIADIRDAATYKTPDWSNGHLDSANVKETHDRLHGSMKAHFTDGALAQWMGVLDAAIDRDSDGEHVIVTAGGVDKIEFSTLSVIGDSATATGRAHTWITWKIIKPDVPGPRTGRPTTWDLFRARLVNVNGTWLVSELDLEPQGGG
jgi:hypothetical protein